MVEAARVSCGLQKFAAVFFEPAQECEKRLRVLAGAARLALAPHLVAPMSRRGLNQAGQVRPAFVATAGWMWRPEPIFNLVPRIFVIEAAKPESRVDELRHFQDADEQ